MKSWAFLVTGSGASVLYFEVMMLTNHVIYIALLTKLCTQVEYRTIDLLLEIILKHYGPRTNPAVDWKLTSSATARDSIDNVLVGKRRESL